VRKVPGGAAQPWQNRQLYANGNTPTSTLIQCRAIEFHSYSNFYITFLTFFFFVFFFSLKDINKYFDRVYELTLEELSTNQALSNGLVVTPKTPNFSSSSPEFGIIKTVIRTGEIKNIQNDESGDSNHVSIVSFFDLQVQILLRFWYLSLTFRSSRFFAYQS
jgi:hypothetical protein